MASVLIVADNDPMRKYLKEMLQVHHPGLLVEAAASETEALQKLATDSPNIVFMNLEFHDESGLELTRKIKARHPFKTIIVMSSLDGVEYRKAAFASGADHFVVKDSLSGADIAILIKMTLAGSYPLFDMISIGYPASV